MDRVIQPGCPGQVWHCVPRGPFKNMVGPDQCGSAGWESSCKAKGHLCDSWVRARARVVGSVPGQGVNNNVLDVFLSH